MGLVVGVATTFKREGNDRTGIKNNSTANNQHTGSARTMHREAHSPIEMARSANAMYKAAFPEQKRSCYMVSITYRDVNMLEMDQ